MKSVGRVLALACGVLLALPPGWCCGATAGECCGPLPLSAPAPVKSPACPGKACSSKACSSKGCSGSCGPTVPVRSSATPTQPQKPDRPCDTACCERPQAAAPKVEHHVIDLGTVGVLVAFTDPFGTGAESVVVSVPPRSAFPPLHILHCVWLC